MEAVELAAKVYLFWHLVVPIGFAVLFVGGFVLWIMFKIADKIPEPSTLFYALGSAAIILGLVIASVVHQ